MRVIPILLVFASITANAQVWEKSIAPGVVYRMEVDTQATRVIHAIRFARDAGSINVLPQLAQGSVFGKDDEKKGREVLSSTIDRYSAIAGVNGDFFTWTGDPLGAMVRDGELVSKPFVGRSVFGWGPGYSKVARLKWSANASFLGKDSLKIDGFNEACSKDFMMLNSHDAGYAV